MSGPHSAGKGDRPRAEKPGAFAAGYEAIRWRTECRLVEDGDGHWFVIKADEVPVFVHWLAAQRGERRAPAGFNPVQVDGPHTVVFTGWREATE